ncbi:TlpA family protein disulfide reductase [Formosa haliotis]|uniref:TlpA family protein disulfide reductase n=1 Tax=Formosa haliotis TaxID=1555194 RepID=UPI000825BB87|nr:TlpA disulfide reductase family protein [Formosa haliotis]
MKMNFYLKTVGVIALILLISMSCAKEEQSKNTMAKVEVPISNIEAENAFKNLDTLKSYFCDYPEECERYKKLTYLEKRKFEEKVYKNRLQLALNFLDSYPNDPHYFEVLKFFFNLNFEPWFLQEVIPDSLSLFLSKEIKYGTLEYYKRRRSLPIDIQARSEWLNKGHELAQKFLKTDAPIEDKLNVEVALMARDFRLALRKHKGLNIKKQGLEAQYWRDFDKYYWEWFLLKMFDLTKKYSETEIIADYVNQFNSLMTSITPHLTQSYWEGFLDLTAIGQPLSNNAGFKAIHEMAKINLEALERIDLSKPLEMEFTSINGDNINLKDMRGKVVLIDFWSIVCAPCITEMPHIQEMYDKYRDQGFEVIGLAADGDSSKDRVLEIIKKQGATWPQSLDKGKDVVVSYHSLLNIKGYPTVWLLNKEGIIVDKNARRERLEPLIRQYLGLED